MILTPSQLQMLAGGGRVYLPVKTARFECLVIAARIQYGHVRLELQPVAGEGRLLVNIESVTPADEKELL
jgi:hypothetical protein